MARTAKKKIGILDEGIFLTDDVDTIDFTGSGVTGTIINKDVTEDIGGGGGPTSVSNSDGTLVISPTTGAVVASLNLSHENTWNERQIFDTILGTEKVTNGGFTGSASGWSVGSGYAYSSNTVVHNSNGTAALSQSGLAVVGESYLLTFTISGWTVGSVTPSIGGVSLTARSANGTYTEYVTVSSTAALAFTPSNTARFTIDDVSLKKVSGGGGVKATNTRTATSTYTSVESAPVAWSGKAWKSNAVAASQNIDFEAVARGLTGATVVTSEWVLRGSINGVAFSDLLKISGSGKQTTKIVSGAGELIGYEIDAPFSNSGPGTTQHIKMTGPSGGFSWITYYFNSVLRASIGAGHSGELKLYQSGGSGVEFYSGSAGLGSPSLYSYNYGSAFVHSQYGAFGAGVSAGSQSFPTSTLQSYGSTALKVARLTANGNIDNTATHWLLDGTTAAACTGTPSAACSSWGNQTDCEKWDAHGGCSWFAGNSCSVYNNESGMSSCTGTSGCSADQSSCTSAGDESSCNSLDDSYGGSCSWNPGSDCSIYSGDESTCSSTSGCTPGYSACSWNGSSCDGGGGCSGYIDEMSCNAGMYFSGCSGTYGVGCTGDYYTGNCSGVYGTACTGTSSCTGIDDSTNCGNETGCTWSSVLLAQLPDGELYPDRTYWIYNDASGGADAVLVPYSGQTVDLSSSYTLAAYKDWVHIAYYKKTKSCSVYVSAGACTPTDCTANYSNCSWDSGGGTCSGDAVCTGIGDQSTCEATTYFSSCSGTEILAKNWYKFGS